LEDELALPNIEWTQSFKELRTRMESLEETIQGLQQTIQDLKQVHENDMNFIISALLNEIPT